MSSFNSLPAPMAPRVCSPLVSSLGSFSLRTSWTSSALESPMTMLSITACLISRSVVFL